MPMRTPIKYTFILIISLVAAPAFCDIETDARQVKYIVLCGKLVDSEYHEAFIYETDKESRSSAHAILVDQLMSRYPKEDVDKMFLNAFMDYLGLNLKETPTQAAKELLSECRGFFNRLNAGE